MRDPVAVVRHLAFPGQLARPGIDRQQVGIGGQVIDVAVVDREVPCAVAEPHVLTDVLGPRPAIVPQQIAGGGVECLEVIASRIGDIHDAVVDERPDLLRAVIHGAHPHEL